MFERRGTMLRTVVIALLVLALATTVVVAASVHFKPKGPTFRDNGTTLTVNGTLAGLGKEDVTITVQASGTASTVGFNRGGNSAPGQNIKVTATATTTIRASDISQNGEAFFSIETPPPRQPTATEAGFPNNNWTAVITDVAFTSVTITVVQGGEVVLKQTFKL